MYRDLMQQARRLATVDPKRPKQVNLRRAVSAAYYALFHFVVGQSCRAILGTSYKRTAYRNALSRAYEHATLKKACEAYSRGNLPLAVSRCFSPEFSIANEATNFAHVFLDAQQRRHLADYDLAVRFARSDVLALVDQIEDSIVHFESMAIGDPERFFLVSLIVWDKLSKRG